MCSLVGECDGVKSLIGLLSEDHALCVMYTAQCLSALSVDSKLRSQCVEQEVVTKLVDKLNHRSVNIHPYHYVCMYVHTYVCKGYLLYSY